MKMYNVSIKIDIEDPLCQFIECQVEILLRKLLTGTKRGYSFTLEGSEKVLHKNLIGTSSDKSIENRKSIFKSWKKNYY